MLLVVVFSIVSVVRSVVSVVVCSSSVTSGAGVVSKVYNVV